MKISVISETYGKDRSTHRDIPTEVFYESYVLSSFPLLLPRTERSHHFTVQRVFPAPVATAHIPLNGARADALALTSGLRTTAGFHGFGRATADLETQSTSLISVINNPNFSRSKSYLLQRRSIMAA